MAPKKTASNKVEIIAEPNKASFTTRRIVDAPRSLVFEAFTKPEYLKRWLGPRNLTMVICDNDLREDGYYRFVHRDPAGQEFAFHGEYQEIVPPERIVRTFIFEPFPEQQALETLSLQESNGKTTITTTAVYPNVKSRDAQLGGDMEAGTIESYERLDELLAELQAGRSYKAAR